MIGEFTYLMVNKSMADKYYYTDYFDGSAANTTFGMKAPVAELIKLVAENEDTSVIAPMYGMADFPLVRY